MFNFYKNHVRNSAVQKSGCHIDFIRLLHEWNNKVPVQNSKGLIANYIETDPMSDGSVKIRDWYLKSTVNDLKSFLNISDQKVQLNTKSLYMVNKLNSKTLGMVERYEHDTQKEYQANMALVSPKGIILVHEWMHVLDMASEKTLNKDDELRKLLNSATYAGAELLVPYKDRHCWIHEGLQSIFGRLNKGENHEKFLEYKDPQKFEELGRLRGQEFLDSWGEKGKEDLQQKDVDIKNILLINFLGELFSNKKSSKDWTMGMINNISKGIDWDDVSEYSKSKYVDWFKSNSATLEESLKTPLSEWKTKGFYFWLEAPFYWTRKMEVLARASEQAYLSYKVLEEKKTFDWGIRGHLTLNEMAQEDLRLWQENLIMKFQKIGKYLQENSLPWENKNAIKEALEARRTKLISTQLFGAKM